VQSSFDALAQPPYLYSRPVRRRPICNSCSRCSRISARPAKPPSANRTPNLRHLCPNKSGSLYGLTILSPILDDESATPSHDLQIREYLATLPPTQTSPFASRPAPTSTRLAVMDDVIYVGMPSCEEHLKFKYLVWEANFDGELEPYLAHWPHSRAAEIDAIWSHCVGYPGTGNWMPLSNT
jgi:hypothetical protein